MNSTASARNSKLAGSPLVIPDVSELTCKQAAHAYLRAGFWPIPWVGNKMPAGRYSRKGWSYDTVKRETHRSIDGWRDDWQVGLITHPRTGVLALDIDDPDKFREWDDYPFSMSGEAETGRDGGRHYVYDGRELEEWPKQGNIPGGQVKTAGFIGVEPSRHPNGNYYRWAESACLLYPIGKAGPFLVDYRNRKAARNGNGAAPDPEGLWKDVLEAQDGLQRDAMFAWASDAHKRSLSDDEIVNQLWLAVLEKKLRSWRPRDPWTREGIREYAIPTGGWKHSVNGSMSDAMSRDLADIDNLHPVNGRLRSGYRQRPERKAFIIRPMSDTFEEISEDIGPDNVVPVSGIIHVIGESNVGKSPFSYWILLERVRAGQTAGIYDSEMGAFRIQKKLIQLGASEEELGRILNFGDWGQRRNILPAAQELLDEVVERGVQTFLFDSLVSMLSASGIEENNSTRVREWHNEVAGVLALNGIAVLIIDHPGLGSDERGRGSSDKKPACDFSFSMRSVKPGRVGESGEYRLKCIKDRSAMVIGQEMELLLEARPDGSFSYKPAGWTQGLDDFKPNFSGSISQDEIRELLTDYGPLSMKAIAQKLGDKYEAVRSAVRRGKSGKSPVFAQLADGRISLVS